MHRYFPKALFFSLVYFTMSDAAVITVTSTANSGTGTLRSAISSAAAGDTIQFQAGLGTITLSSPLPPITQNNLTIVPLSATQTINGSNVASVFFVSENVTGISISNLIIQNAKATGGAGGNGGGGGGGGGMGAGAGLLVAEGASVTISNVSFTNNVAQGGSGGASQYSTTNGGGGFGGGGGFKGKGGTAPVGGVGSGGGGGFEGAGGNSTQTGDQGGGGGGGGMSGSGGNSTGTPGGGGGGTSGGGGTGSGSSAGNGGSSGGGGGGGSGREGGQSGTNSGGTGSPAGANGQPGTSSGSNVGGDGGSGGAGGTGGGGGGGGAGGEGRPSNSEPGGTSGDGGSGGYGGGGGGGGGIQVADGSGGSGGKWGGSGAGFEPGNGGFAGGGGAGQYAASGGFGGGGGGGSVFPGKGGFGAGSGGGLIGHGTATQAGGGGGGAGLGGAIFVESSGTLNILNPSFSGNSAIGGAGGGTSQGLAQPGVGGSGLGPDLFLQSGSTTNFTASSAPLTINTNIASDQGAGGGSGGGIAINGPQVISFGGTNTYTGGTTVNAGGTLSVSSDLNLGATSETVTLNGTGILNTTNTTAPDYFTTSRSIILNGGGNLQPITNSNGIYNGVISGTGPLSISGGGTVFPSAQNTYTGGTLVTGSVSVSSDGNLGNTAGNVTVGNNAFFIATQTFSTARAFTLSGNANMHVSSGMTFTIDGVVTGGNIFKNLQGNLNLTNLNNTFTGTTTVSSGTLQGFCDTTPLSTLPLTITNNSLVTFNQPGNGTYTGSIGGAGALSLFGSGILTLTGTNNYTGGTTLHAAAISIGAASNLGTGGINFAGNSSLLLTGPVSSNQTVTINSGVTAVIGDQGVGNTSTFGGTIQGGGTLNLNMTSPGTLVLANPQPNTYSGGTLMQSGTLSISNGNNLGTGPVTFTGSSTLALTAPLTVPSSTQIFINGGVTATLNDGGNNSFINTPIQDGTPAGGALQKLGGGVMTLTAASTYTGPTTIGAGTLALSGSGSVASSSGIAINGGAILDISQITPSSYTAGLITGSGTIGLGNKAVIVNLPAAAAFNGNIVDTAISGATGGSLVVNQNGATGTLTLSGVNTYTGGTTLNAGGLTVTTGTAFPSGTNLTINNGATFDASNAAVVNLNVDVLQSDMNPTTNTLNLGPTDLFVNSGAFYGTIPTGGSLNKFTSGTLTLSGVNNYTGNTNIHAGTLSISNGNSLGAPVSVLTFYGGTLATTGSGNITVNHDVDLILGNPGTVEVDNPQTTITGNISDTGSLIKTGSGTLILTGTNSYSGGTTVSAGILQGNTTSLQGDILDNASVVFDQAAGGTYADVLSGSGSVTKQGAGLLTLTGANTYSGGTTLSAGALQGNGTAVVMPLQGNINITNAGSSVIFDQVGSNSYGGVVSGIGSFTKQNTGTLTLTNANTFTGTTSITGGTLALSGSGAISNSNSVNVSLGAIFDISQITPTTYSGDNITGTGTIGLGNKNLIVDITGSATFGGILTDTAISGLTGGSLTVNSPSSGATGTLVLTGANTYTGGTQIGGGTVSIGAVGNLGTGPLAFIGNGTLQFSAAINPFNLPISIGSGFTGTINDGGFNSEISSLISGDGALQKAGGGTLVLSAANTYGGGTIVSGGNLQGNGTALIMPLQGNINITNAGSTVIFDQTGSNTYAGIISGTGGMAKQNTGTLNMTGASTYTGTTAINGGTVAIVGSGSLSPSSPLQISSGTFDISGFTGGASYTAGDISGALGTAISIGNVNLIAGTANSPASFNGNMTGSGSFTKQNTGTLTFGGTNTYGGGTTINGGTLAITALTALPTGTNLAINNSGILDAAGAGPGTIAVGNLSGNGGAINLGANNLTTTATAATTFTSSGSGINGTGALSVNGGPTLTLIGANTYSGGTTISGSSGLSIGADNSLGSGTLHFNGGTLFATNTFSTTRTYDMMAGGGTVNLSFPHTLTLNSGLTGAGNFIKTGFGRMVLGASNAGYTGAVTVNQGFLHVDNSLPVAVTVNPFGGLSGTGPIGSVVNNGIVSPGNSIGTMTITGNYSQGSSGTLLIEIDAAGNSDLLSIGGTASLDGAIDVIPLPGAYFANSSIVYTVLNAAGGRSGTFSKLNVLDPGGRLDLQIEYEPSLVLLHSASNRFFIQPVIKEHNPRQVALYLESLQYFQNGQPIPQQEDLIGVIRDLATLSGDALTKALDMLHPAQFGEFGLVNSDVRSQVSSMLNRHPREECCKHLIELIHCENSSLWLEPFGMRVIQKPRDDQRGFVSDTGGAVLGGDYCFTNGLLLGAAIGGNTTYLKWSEGMGHAHLPSAFASLYADWSNKWAFVEASVLGGFDFFRTLRHIHFPGENRKAKSKHYGYDWSAHLGGGFDFQAGTLYFEPFFNLDYATLHQNGFKEHGADSLNLKVQAKNFGLLRAEEGISFTKSFQTGRGCFSPRVWASLVTSVPFYGKNYTSALQGQESSFTVWTYHKTVNRFSPGIELIWSINNAVALAAKYGAEMGRDIVEQKADLRFEWDF